MNIYVLCLCAYLINEDDELDMHKQWDNPPYTGILAVRVVHTWVSFQAVFSWPIPLFQAKIFNKQSSLLLTLYQVIPRNQRTLFVSPFSSVHHFCCLPQLLRQECCLPQLARQERTQLPLISYFFGVGSR